MQLQIRNQLIQISRENKDLSQKQAKIIFLLLSVITSVLQAFHDLINLFPLNMSNRCVVTFNLPYYR